MAWCGADPGGRNNFGIAALHSNGSFETWCCSSVDEALQLMGDYQAVGIDCPMWWTSATGGGRSVDGWLRQAYGIHPGTVQSVNSLKGSVVVQGILLAMRLRERSPSISITEAHPKALLKALQLARAPWEEIAEAFQLSTQQPAPSDEHRRDALLSAVAAREGARGTWRDLATEIERGPEELDPGMWFGPVSYWWPKVAKNCTQ